MLLKIKNLIVVFVIILGQLASAKDVVWTWQNSSCINCAIKFRMLSEDIKNNPRMVEFLSAIANEKQNILKLYDSDPQEYNLLAHMAVGILGNESTFFSSWRYKVKSHSQLAITWGKALRAWFNDDEASPNSKGPTQIKRVPERIEQFYNISENDLWTPKFAAVSTMGYLIEALAELKQRAKNNNLEFITPATYVDYLPYIYFGGARKLINRTATPDTNIYVKNMKLHMKRAIILEVDP